MDLNKKILFLASEFPPGPGGIGRHTYYLCRQFAERNWKVKALVNQDYCSGGERRIFNKKLNYKIENFRRFSPVILLKLYKIIKTFIACLFFSPDIIILSGISSLKLGWFLKKIFNKPVLALLHGDEAVSKDGLVSKAYLAADKIIAISNFTKDNFSIKGIEKDKVRVIYCGISDKFKKSDNRRDTSNTILTVGNLTERKGQDIVVRALEDVVKVCPNVKYVMAGLLTQKEQITEIARRVGVFEKLEFKGVVTEEELLTLYHNSTLFVLPSRKTEKSMEGFGLVALEAMACGCPVIVSDETGIFEIIKKIIPECVFHAGDKKDLAEKISYFLNDTDVRENISSKCIKLSQAFRWKNICKEYEEEINKLL
ncbi:MAG: glycosyltransferase family 4 protein [Candidatus Omnitrophica bacterium]|nr:glycosyltransferase family 4 protein [Candidatus Omnitrophota bacterium]MDD5441627.1 glycosyltransferase family 4 protein [Candidatus Omnitrophota bacterium]